MSKAILVIDIPECCEKCPVEYEYCSEHGTKRYSEKSKWCPLRPMPTKKVVLFDPDRTDEDEARRIVYEVEGYNRCVDEIEGIENG